MTKWQKMLKKKINETNIDADMVVCHRDSTVSVKCGYFYRHGNTAAKWAAKVLKILAAVDVSAKLVSATDEWRPWPKESYFVVKVAKSVCRFCPTCGSDAVWPECYSEVECPGDVEWTVAAMLGSWECECGWTGWNPGLDLLDSVPYYKAIK